MSAKWKKPLQGIVALCLISLSIWLLIWVIQSIWHQFVALDPNLRVSLLTAVTTVLVATLTVVLGRYFERKKEVESHYRQKKTEIYDSFLKEFFKLFNNDADENVDLVPFLREWQRQMVLWGGAEVLVTFLKWRQHLAKGVPDAQSMFMTDDFFKAIRRDLGLSNNGLERGVFARLILRNPDLFFLMAKTNPNVTLDELAEKEKELGLD